LYFSKLRIVEQFWSGGRTVRLPFWTKAPLIALVIVSIGPEIADAAFSRPFIWPGTVFLLIMTAFFALINWPFLALYFVCARQVKKDWPNVRSVRLAMWISLAAMCFASIGSLFLTATEMEGLRTTGSIVILLFVEFAEELVPHLLLFTSVPILGLIGWFAGRFIAWVTRSTDLTPEMR
jgi:hypothetical protein